MQSRLDFFDLDMSTIKLCSVSVRKDKKMTQMLADYYFSLSEDEQECFRQQSEWLLSLVKLGAKKYKITKNAILIAIRLKEELNITCYPFINKIATKGWGTSGGTFSWSMSYLKHPGDVNSFDKASALVSRNRNICIDAYHGFDMVSVE